MTQAGQSPGRPRWTFLTNHGQVLLAVAAGLDRRVSDIAADVGISPRATLTILKDLEDTGYIGRERVGRRTNYSVDQRGHFRHDLAADHEVGELLAIFSHAENPSAGAGAIPDDARR
jgi:predicted ArsR family transcriptional regulator